MKNRLLAGAILFGLLAGVATGAMAVPIPESERRHLLAAAGLPDRQWQVALSSALARYPGSVAEILELAALVRPGESGPATPSAATILSATRPAAAGKGDPGGDPGGVAGRRPVPAGTAAPTGHLKTGMGIAALLAGIAGAGAILAGAGGSSGSSTPPATNGGQPASGDGGQPSSGGGDKSSSGGDDKSSSGSGDKPSSGGDDGRLLTPIHDDHGDGDRSAFFTPEFLARFGLTQINAAHAYGRGGTGAGVRVGIVDSGIDATHPEFAGRIGDGGHDLVAGGTGTGVDRLGHGTAVASIIAGARDGHGLHGVAPEASLVPYRVFETDSATPDDIQLASLVDFYARQSLQVVNNSFGITHNILDMDKERAAVLDRSAWIGAYRQLAATARPPVHVWAAGNAAQPNPGVLAGLPLLYPELERFWVAVIALDQDGKAAGFTNACGVAARWCIAAPGQGVTVATPGGGYGAVAGASFAAPYVSGAMALLLQMFPGVPPADIRHRLLVTANKTGDYAKAHIYGHGLLDLDRATRPVGGVMIPRPGTGGPEAPGGESRPGAGAGPGSGGDGPGASGPQRFRPGPGAGGPDPAWRLVVLDSLGAPFQIPLAAFLRPARDGFDSRASLAGFGRAPQKSAGFGPDARVTAHAPLTFGPGRRLTGPGLSLTVRLARGVNLHAAHNRLPVPGVGFQGDGTGHAAAPASPGVTPGAFLSPWPAFAGNGFSLGLTTGLGPAGDLSFSGFQGTASRWLTGVAPAGDAHARGATIAWGIDVPGAESPGKEAAGGRISLHGGTLVERGRFLGSRGEGAFGGYGDAHTVFGGLSVRLPVPGANRLGIGGLALAGSYHTGRSRVPPGQASLFTEIGTMDSHAFTLGAIGRQVWRRDDRLGVSLHQPLRIATGTATLNLPVGRDPDGTVRGRAMTFDLAPPGRELDLEVFYKTPLGARTDVSASAMLRHQPGHVKTARDEGVLMIRFNHRF